VRCAYSFYNTTDVGSQVVQILLNMSTPTCCMARIIRTFDPSMAFEQKAYCSRWGETTYLWNWASNWPFVHPQMIVSEYGMILTGKQKTPSATLLTTNQTCPDLGANRGLRDKKPATNRLSYGNANKRHTDGIRHEVSLRQVQCGYARRLSGHKTGPQLSIDLSE
jgi:hypothetical protein